MVKQSITARTALERVARLERENAELRARIDRIRNPGPLEDTVISTRRAPSKPNVAIALGLAMTTIGLAIGLLISMAASRAHARPYAAQPARTLAPLADAPPVIYAAPVTPACANRQERF